MEKVRVAPDCPKHAGAKGGLPAEPALCARPASAPRPDSDTR